MKFSQSMGFMFTQAITYCIGGHVSIKRVEVCDLS